MGSGMAARLRPVVDIAEREEREAARQLGQGHAQLQQARLKLEELEGYYEDYQQRWLAQGQQGVSGNWLLNYQNFLSQLETALAQQRCNVDWQANNLQKLRQTWQQRNARVEGLRKLVDRYLQQARRAADRQEQKQLDEFCQRLSRTRRHD